MPESLSCGPFDPVPDHGIPDTTGYRYSKTITIAKPRQKSDDKVMIENSTDVSRTCASLWPVFG